jgi:hypothetical protein
MIQLAIQQFLPQQPPPDTQPAAAAAIDATRNWVEKAVIGLNLCPFAKAVHIKNQVRYAVSDAGTPAELLTDLMHELQRIAVSEPSALDTTLLIHPYTLTDFAAYNDFLDLADALVAELGLEGELQIASFHPGYQFAYVPGDDISNYTNRSPYPVLHILRETSISRAVDAIPNADDIFAKNIETLQMLGLEGWEQLLRSAAKPAE